MSITTQRDNPVAKLRAQLTSMTPEFKNALPSHIKPERFQRVVMTVVQQQPDLLAADRASLLAACTKCAADGLVPDGREAALVIFNTKNRSGAWEKKVQYMPMLAGILKRARNSGEIAGIVVNVVYANDDFIQRPDDFDHPIEHRPPRLGSDRGEPIGAYAIAKLKDGTIMHEVMDWNEIERVKASSRSRDRQGNIVGPWADWPDQMARKSAFRRLAKYLPMDAAPEMEALMRRDDELGGPMVEAVAETVAPVIDAQPSKLDALEGLTIDNDPDLTPDPEDDGWSTTEDPRSRSAA